MFGEISMLLRSEQGTTTATIVADENGTEVIKYKIDYVMEVCRAEHELSQKLHKIISLKLSERLRNFGSAKHNTWKTVISTSINATADNSLSDDNEKSEKSEKLAISNKSESEDNLGQLGKKDGRVSRGTLHEAGPPPVTTGLSSAGSENEGRKSQSKLEKKVSQARMTAKKEKEKSKKEKNLDDGFKWFRLPKSEVVFRTFDCAMKSTITARGTLYLSTSYLCFSANIFGRRTKDRFNFLQVQDINLRDKRIELTQGVKNFIFKDFEGTTIEEAFTTIKKFYDQKKSSIGSDATCTLDEETEPAEENWLAPNDDDWTNILEGTRSIHLQKEEKIILQSQAHKQRLYQIAKGSCRIEKQTDDGKTHVIGIINANTDSISKNDTIFGEISFLEGTDASASVVADENDTVVHVIEGYYLDVLFEYYPGLSGRFYHFLATVLSTRLKQREAAALKGKDVDEESEIEEYEKSTKNPIVTRAQNSDVKKKKKKFKTNGFDRRRVG